MRVTVLLVCVAFAGCLDDPDPRTDGPDTTEPEAAAQAWSRPLPDPLTGLESLGFTPDIARAAGIWLDGDIGYAASQGAGLYTIDITDPRNTSVIGLLSDDVSPRDVEVFEQNGTRIAALADGSEISFVDVTHPEAPFLLGAAGGLTVHNIAVVPGTSIVYNSRSVSTPGIDVVDASDPEHPELVNTFGDLTCHDVTFYMPEERAFCAGIRETQIWDVSDPVAPVVIQRIVNPAIQIHHWALPAHNGTLLIIGDEFGGSTDAAAGCLVNTEGPTGTVSDPVGAIWFYDISGETPLPISWTSAELPSDHVPPTPCTAHFGQIMENDLLLVGWRAAGLLVIDFSDLDAPQTVAKVPTQGDIWEARYHNGYVFAGDNDQGFEAYLPV